MKGNAPCRGPRPDRSRRARNADAVLCRHTTSFHGIFPIKSFALPVRHRRTKAQAPPYAKFNTKRVFKEAPNLSTVPGRRLVQVRLLDRLPVHPRHLRSKLVVSVLRRSPTALLRRIHLPENLVLRQHFLHPSHPQGIVGPRSAPGAPAVTPRPEGPGAARTGPRRSPDRTRPACRERPGWRGTAPPSPPPRSFGRPCSSVPTSCSR